MTGHSREGRTTNASLNEEAVRRIRLMHRQGESTRVLAKEYGVGVETVRRVLRWETWAWVSEEGSGAEAEDWQHPPLTQEEKDAAERSLLKLQGLLLEDESREHKP